VSERRTEVRDIAVARNVQTNEVGRCAALAPALLELSAGMPLRLLELGTSAGLNLRWDRYRYESLWGDVGSRVRLVDRYEGASPAPFASWPSAEVFERRGCDRSPVDAASDEGALTLLSYIWPDQAERVALLRGAIEIAREVPACIDESAAGYWLAEVLAEPLPEGVVTVVFHSIFWQYVAEEERERIGRALAAAGSRATAGSRLAWLRMESDGADTRIDVTTWPGHEQRLVARAGYHGRPVRWLG
jgi:hypothetical protein